MSSLARVERGVRTSFRKVRDELDDHLETINRNSEEIHGLYEFLMGLEQKLDKLAERIDDLQAERERPVSAPLTMKEQEAFLLLYATDDPLPAESLAQHVGIPTPEVPSLVMSMARKGIPILEHDVSSGVAYALELRFKELQMRQNVVPIDARVSRSLSRRV